MWTRFWKWLHGHFVQSDPAEEYLTVKRSEYPDLLELWRLPEDSPQGTLPHCCTLVATVQRGHDAAPRFGRGEYWLTTMSGQLIDHWLLAWSNECAVQAARQVPVIAALASRMRTSLN